MTAQSALLNAVRRKLNVTWSDEGTDARVQDVVDSVSPRLASLLGYAATHEFSAKDGEAWGLFLNGCLYEFSDAWDDFVSNYEREIQSVRLLIIASDYDPESDIGGAGRELLVVAEIYDSVGDEDAEAQG